MKYSVLVCMAILLMNTVQAQATDKKGMIRILEPCECQVKVDSSFKTRCAYLVVPENRKKNNGKTIKLPFIWVESKNPDKKKDPFLFTAGGPGGSSLGWATGAARSQVISNRDCIAFEQRGTRFAIPELRSFELDSAIKESYRKNLNKDSMVVEGTKRYRRAMAARGIDLSGYNTDETVADIADLLTTLGIDSVNLNGGSYSGGLMLAVLQNDPSRVRSLVLDSPLPTFIPIDEDEPVNFMEALNIIFDRVARDSAGKPQYANLKERFLQYFNSIAGKTFYIRYLEKGTVDSVNIAYTKNDLLEPILNNIYPDGFKSIAAIVLDMINGNHQLYMRDKLDGLFRRNSAPNAMRISVYCADQAAYNNEAIIEQSYQVYPLLRGFRINDVWKAMCDCWDSPPIKKNTKQPFYSAKPALLADGLLDNACRPVYIDLIHHYLPNSQRILFNNRGHMVGGRDFNKMVAQFLDNPFSRIVSDQADIIVY
jgi:pimeloyl-ACP methyl ester carboxylesterase